MASALGLHFACTGPAWDMRAGALQREYAAGMPITLYDASVSNYVQALGAASHFLEKASKHCSEHGLDLAELVETRVYPDMLPFRYQIQAMVHHSLKSLEALESGVFRPNTSRVDHDYPGLQGYLKETQAALEQWTPARVNALEEAKVVFDGGTMQLPFTGANFVLSFSLPNFYFHAATAYGILRAKGVPLGKRDFMGRVRIQR